MAYPVIVDRKELLPHIVDAVAAKEPEALFAEYPVNPTSYELGYQKISYGTFANAINGVAWWLQGKLGVGKEFPTLAYIGPNNILVNSFVLGAVKAGYKTLLISPRNSIRAQENLFAFTECKILVTTSPQPVALQATIAALSETGIQVLELPNILELTEQPHPHFPYAKTFGSAKKEPFVVLHTSGTTELPKPIVWNHDYYATQLLEPEPPAGYVNQQALYAGVRLFNTLPYFHAAGIYFGLLIPIYKRSVVIHTIAGLPSARLLIDGLKHTKADMAMLVPPYAIDIAQSTESLDFISKNLQRVFYCGGAIPPNAGNAISSRIEFSGHVGSTETGFYPSLKPAGQKSTFWGHYQYDPHANISFEHQADDLYEAVWNKSSDQEKEQCVFKAFPKLHTWRSKDLYSPHPTEPDLWLYRGRADDIIVFLTGEKTNPTSMENHIKLHPEIQQAMVIGTLRFQAALIVELIDQKPLSTIDRAKAIERLWPTIEEANATCPAHARVTKSHILFTEPGRPVVLSAKGTFQRTPTLREYAAEIEKLYADADKMSPYTIDESVQSGNHIDINDTNAVHELIRKAVLKVTKWDNFQDSDNLFIQGMDSLQALQLIRYLRKALDKPDLAITILYTSPSLNQLSETISSISTRDSNQKGVNELDRDRKIEELLHQYYQRFDNIIGVNEPALKLSPVTDHVVILTGSTGSLGSFILGTLMKNQSVKHIYCLDRSSDSHLRHLKKNHAENKPVDFPAFKVTFLQADLATPRLGLSDEMYERIRNSATEFIHSAWPVNFNVSLDTFKPQLDGIINILSLMLAIPQHTRTSLLFISSISSIMGLKAPKVPEKMLDNTSAPLPMGYAESKYIAEHILNYAAKKKRLSATDIKIARVGQIAGSAHTFGVWNKSEWVPSLVATSFHMGIIPENLGNDNMKLDWVPIDILSSALVDIAFCHNEASSNHGTQVLHPVNKNPVAWSTLLPIIVKTLNASKPPVSHDITVVPYTTWVQRLRETARENALSMKLEEMLEQYPAIKLLEFFETLPETPWSDKDVSEAVKASPHLASLSGIEWAWMEKWVKGWI